MFINKSQKKYYKEIQKIFSVEFEKLFTMYFRMTPDFYLLFLASNQNKIVKHSLF